MDGDMQVDSDAEKDSTTSSGFIFSTPNIIPSPEKVLNFGIQSDNVFGGRPTQQSEASTFTFAKPGIIESTQQPMSSTFIFAKPAIIEKIDLTDEPDELDESKELKEPNEPDKDVKIRKVKSKSSLLRDAHKSSPFSAQEIKKLSAFSRLEKNSKKIKDVKLELSNSISCLDVPDTLLVKSVAKEYFDQFGETLKVTIRPRRKIITVYYASKEDATRAYKKSGSFLGHEFQREWTTPDILLRPKKNESIKGKIASILNIDDEVKEELAAMRGLEYNLPDPQNLKALRIAAKAKVKKAKIVANKEVTTKTSIKTLKTTVPKYSNIPTATKTTTTTPKPLLKLVKPLPSTEKLKVLEPTIGNQIKKISLATIEELQNQVKQSGTTSEEKYKILDARDRLMRLRQEKQKSLATAKVTKGTCPDMCPEKERYMREFQRQLASYEQLEGNDYKINPSTAIKQYSRSSADQEEPMAHDLRPVKSLKMTMSYLLHEIADLCEEDEPNLAEWYHYLWDRMRSIRKDITQQELCCVDTVELVEQCARFHILCSERLCAEEVAVFDPKINSENLTKCLQTLKYMYYDLRENGIFCKNEPEFRAYVILLNLNNGTFISELSTLPPEVQNSSEVKFALDVYSALAMDNYSRFFKLVRKTTYLNACILLRYFNQVRVKALTVMVKAYCRASGTTEYPLYELIDILGFEDEDEVFEFCGRVGLMCDKESLYIKLNKESFRRPESNLEQARAFNLVLSKRLSSEQLVGQCVAGSTLPEKTYNNHKPHNSFDAQGYLLPSSINARDQGLESDPYEFMDDEAQIEEKGIKNVNRIANNVDAKKQINTTDGPTNEFMFKPKPEVSVPVASNESPPITTNNSNIFVPKTTESKIFAPTLNNTTIFSMKPSSTVFPTIPTKPSTLPTTSPFNMIVNKGIFAGNNVQKNLFKLPTTPVISLKHDSSSIKVPSTSSSHRISTKRPLDDDESSKPTLEKKSFTDKEELRKRQLETENKLRIELEKLHRLERINKLTSSEYQELEAETIEEECASIVRAELERIKLIDVLSNKIFDSLFRELCEGILDEQLFIQDMLIEVERRLRDKLVMKYYRIWKQWAAKRRAQRREALDNTPVWLQPESLEECARKLYHPQQKLAIKYARELKKKSLEKEEKKPRHAPIQFIIGVGLKENIKSFDVEANQHSFWKMVISWPLLENRLTLWRHKKAINKYLSPEDYTLEPIFIQHKPNPQERLDICIRHFEGLICDNCLTGMDALLFIVSADEEARSVERRLTKSVLSREKLMPVPLVIIVFGDEESEPENVKVSPMIETLLESGYISEYTILYERSSDENIVLRVVQSATLWLSINKSPTVPLEMDYLKRVFDDCLTEEFWLRIQGHLSPDPQFTKPLNDPNFIINLHNEAVNHMMDIILDPESMSYTEFAPELKIYLSNKRTYPCTYEYFDNIWKHPEYRAELERIMSNFVFPSWKYAWPIPDMMELHDAIANYCRQMFSYGESLAITNNIMSDLFLIAGFSEDNCPSFADVVLHLVRKKISDILDNTRVVYNKNHIKHFQTLPWWFKSSVLLDYVDQEERKRKQNEDITLLSENLAKTQEVEEVTVSTSQMDLDAEALDELSETLKMQDDEMPLVEFCNETRSHASDVLSIAEKLGKQLEEQRERNKSFEARLREALQDGALDTES